MPLLVDIQKIADAVMEFHIDQVVDGMDEVVGIDTDRADALSKQYRCNIHKKRK